LARRGTWLVLLHEAAARTHLFLALSFTYSAAVQSFPYDIAAGPA